MGERRFTRPGEKRFGIAAVLMNLTVYPLLALWTAIGVALSPAMFVLWKVATRWHTARICRHFIWIYGRGWMMIVAPFVRFERSGLEHAAPCSPSIFVVNHLSFFDTYCMAALPAFDIAFAVRSWPFRIFFYARFMRLARYLDVESLNWEKIIDSASRTFQDDGCLLFFPEGHRSRDGDLQRFYTGAFKLAAETGRPVVPLCITGTDTLLPPGRFWMQPARVKVRALAPVDPADFPGPSGHLEMRKCVKDVMAENLGRMRSGRFPTGGTKR